MPDAGRRISLPRLHRACGHCEFCISDRETLCPSQLKHLAIQYARYMGLHVVAVDIDDDHLVLARRVGAEIILNALTEKDPAGAVQRALGGGAHGALVTAVAPSAFHQAVGMPRRGGTCTLAGLPPGSFDLPIFDVVLERLTVRGSIVGTRLDLHEALAIASEGGIGVAYEQQPLSAVNDVFRRMRDGQLVGRVALDIARESHAVPAKDAAAVVVTQAAATV